MAKILRCDETKCINEYQDKKYGIKMRVCNTLVNVNKESKSRKYRCTVCSKVIES
jgi:hypothetical protein